ncbi:MAG TPA: arsenite methyltransferase, partial [Fimbriimonas sp.]|nr:arsenite methyltransferase [Fimbriimonas sp.]
SCCSGDVITGNLYDSTEAALIPEAALLASLGCGNPTALASLAEGEVVLDLGSGGGIDVLLSARRVGPTGFAYGLDMTDEMLALAEKNREESGATNVKFLKGTIEDIPLPDASVDVIISNCVINLSADKDAVLREALRVLRPGGRFAVSDVVVEGELPSAVRADMEAYVGCVAGALERDDYIARLTAVGFVDASIEPTRRYTFADLEATTCCSPEVAALSPEVKSALDGRVMGAFIRAVKPK